MGNSYPQQSSWVELGDGLGHTFMSGAQMRYNVFVGERLVALHKVLECLPAHLWKDRRRKRSYINQVLARAEVDSGYKPARKLWARTRNGHCLPNPALQLRSAEGWRPVYEALKLDWLHRGTGTDAKFRVRPAAAVARVHERATDSELARPAAG